MASCGAMPARCSRYTPRGGSRSAARSTEELGDVAQFRTPDGGLAFWLTFPRIADLDRIEAQLPALGVRVANSRSFATSKSAPRGLRLGFASLREDEARSVVRTLARAAGAAR